jgi:formyltetrahydrofolate deformylase
MRNYVGLIACQDRAGLVHQITGVLFRRKLNITENHEFVDHHKGRFFMRTQFQGLVDIPDLNAELLPLLPDATLCEVREQQPRNLVVMVSKEPHCLGDLLLRHQTGELNARILAVLSQHETCRDLTSRFDIPFQCITVVKDRDEHERQVLAAVQAHAPDYLVLARYMRIFSPWFVRHFPERIINIHHSFLPAFIGKDPYQQAHHRGVKIIGATSHFVTDALDEGPIITQDVLQVTHSDSPEAMARKGQDVEKLVLGRGLNLALQDRLLIDGNRVIVFD